jgi:hypothetical protein
MLADMCGLIGKTIALIPPEHAEERLSACKFLLTQLNKTIKCTLSADMTEH